MRRTSLRKVAGHFAKLILWMLSPGLSVSGPSDQMSSL
jgi:hypothetical protein